MRALIVVDMLNDFVTGTLANEARATAIVPSIRRLIDHARANEDWVVVYANDAHRADDREIGVWGRHAMAGTHGAAVIDQLAPAGIEREIVVSKRFYGAFDHTDLEDTLFDFEVEDVVLAGQHTHGCDPPHRLRRLHGRLRHHGADRRGLRLRGCRPRGGAGLPEGQLRRDAHHLDRADRSAGAAHRLVQSAHVMLVGRRGRAISLALASGAGAFSGVRP